MAEISQHVYCIGPWPFWIAQSKWDGKCRVHVRPPKVKGAQLGSVTAPCALSLVWGQESKRSEPTLPDTLSPNRLKELNVLYPLRVLPLPMESREDPPALSEHHGSASPQSRKRRAAGLACASTRSSTTWAPSKAVRLHQLPRPPCREQNVTSTGTPTPPETPRIGASENRLTAPVNGVSRYHFLTKLDKSKFILLSWK